MGDDADEVARRVEKLEGRVDTLQSQIGKMQSEVRAQFAEQRAWMTNGFSDKVAAIVGARVDDYRKEEWERERQERELQLKEKEVRDREYGQRRDQEQARDMAKQKLWSAIIPAIIAAIGIIVVAMMGGA